MEFHILDVFGVEKYSGNQLAVFIAPENLSSIEMQQIAKEINFSETTFITSKLQANNGFDIRIFTPASEIDFAGHPTLGTAYMINNLFYSNKATEVVLNLKVGQIPVTFANNTVWMLQKQPVFGKIFSPEMISELLSIPVEAIDERFPIEEVSTGLPFTMVPLKSLGYLKQAAVDLIQYRKFCTDAMAKGILVFSPDAYIKSQNMASRVFVHYLGIPEDPATGSATGCLAAYLLKHNYCQKSEIDIAIGQGYEIGRPSELYIKASVENSEYSIRVGGAVFEIAKGEWDLV
jgi:trans-2,3-dihydro-3-hydroxyanthranilate isomerase